MFSCSKNIYHLHKRACCGDDRQTKIECFNTSNYFLKGKVIEQIEVTLAREANKLVPLLLRQVFIILRVILELII